MTNVKYAWEKLQETNYTLASLDRPLRDRLEHAWEQLQRVDQEELQSLFSDGYLQGSVRRLYEGLEGGAANLEDREAQWLARSIVSLHDAAARLVASDG